jgi:hypothetical protein
MPKPSDRPPNAPSPESSDLTKDTDPAAVTLAFAVIDQVVSVIADYVDWLFPLWDYFLFALNRAQLHEIADYSGEHSFG